MQIEFWISRVNFHHQNLIFGLWKIFRTYNIIIIDVQLLVILYPEIRNSITHQTLAYKVHRFQQTYSSELCVCFAVHKIECGIITENIKRKMQFLNNSNGNSHIKVKFFLVRYLLYLTFDSSYQWSAIHTKKYLV